MATLRGLVDLFGYRSTARRLADAGINQPSGNKINDRWLRDTLKGRVRNGKLVRVPENERFINQKIRGGRASDFPEPGEAVVPSGAETHGRALPSKVYKPDGYWIGQQDTRARVATQELSKDALREILRLQTARLDGKRTWYLGAFGEFLVDKQSGIGSDFNMIGLSAWARQWRRVALLPGRLLSDMRSRESLWQQTERAVRTQIATEQQAATDAARFAGAVFGLGELKKIARKVQRGDPKDGERYPSFAARFCTLASGVVWRRVYAVEIRYPR